MSVVCRSIEIEYTHKNVFTVSRGLPKVTFLAEAEAEFEGGKKFGLRPIIEAEAEGGK